MLVLFFMPLLTHPPSTAAGGVPRAVVFGISISILVAIFILGGAVLHSHADGAFGATFIFGYVCFWFLSYGFLLHDYVSGA